MSMPQQIVEESLLTSYQVGSLLQVNPSSVNKWVRDGRITAFRTPGGHHRIRAGDLVSFLREHSMPVPGALSDAARQRMLVIDKDPKVIEAIEQALEPYAHRVELRTASHGVDALVMVGAFRPNVVLLDASVEGLDSIDVCKRLTGNKDENAPRVHITVAGAPDSLEAEARAAGATACISKPLNADAVLTVLGISGRPN